MMNQPSSQTIWLCKPATVTELYDRVKHLKEWPTAEEIRTAAQANAARPSRRPQTKIGVLPIHGIIQYRHSIWSFLFGGFSIQEGEAALKQMVEDNSLQTVLLDINSPGGEATGVAEFAEQVFRARKQKDIIAIGNAEMASAAYWIGSAASQVSIMPSGEAGSIGAFSAHVSFARQLEQDGVDVSIVRSDPFKAELNSAEQLSDEAKDFMQETIDDLADDFRRAVARNRSTSPATVKANFGQGRMLPAKRALASGLVDKVETMDSLLQRLSSRRRGGGPRLQAEVDAANLDRWIRSANPQAERDLLELEIAIAEAES